MTVGVSNPVNLRKKKNVLYGRAVLRIVPWFPRPLPRCFARLCWFLLRNLSIDEQHPSSEKEIAFFGDGPLMMKDVRLSLQ